MKLELISAEDFQPFLERIEQLEKKVALLQRMAKKDVDTASAMEVTGLSRRALDYERKRQTTLIKWGKKGTKVLYDLQSLILFNESKQLK
ncbi:hypothetical protein [Rufibacter immobilis]|uniref:hypothetical protein n=1 Tax=Rufibacter immobilis TaxID=1348778 RepID=UPI0035E69BDD